jgi:hypothetical protein
MSTTRTRRTSAPPGFLTAVIGDPLKRRSGRAKLELGAADVGNHGRGKKSGTISGYRLRVIAALARPAQAAGSSECWIPT